MQSDVIRPPADGRAAALTHLCWQAAYGRTFFPHEALYGRVRERLIDAHRREAEARAGGGAAHIAPALVLLAGVVALGVERVPGVLGWVIAGAGATWLLGSMLSRRG